MDTNRLRQSFDAVAKHGDAVILRFYSELFLRAPAVRDMFPADMGEQRDKLFGALGAVVSNADNLDVIVPVLQGLGRDHRGFGAQPEHFEVVGGALLSTLEYYAGDAWDDMLARDWAEAYGLVAQVMVDAAREDEQAGLPAVYEGTVTSFERRGSEVAVFTVAMSPHLPYLPGQSTAVESTEAARVWRYYSPANAPRADGTVEFHVRLVDGGLLSSALVHRLYPGATLRLRAPVGTMALDLHSSRPVLMLAGSTGLAPLKAIIEQLAGLASPPATHLFFGARTASGLYDRFSMEELAGKYSWLTVTYAQEEGDCGGSVERGTAVDAALSMGAWGGHDAYVCGSTAMVRAATDGLVSVGMPRSQVHTEDFGWES